jgi:hypothetical protein
MIELQIVSLSCVCIVLYFKYFNNAITFYMYLMY